MQMQMQMQMQKQMQMQMRVRLRLCTSPHEVGRGLESPQGSPG
jgi:hypothetical protein